MATRRLMPSWPKPFEDWTGSLPDPVGKVLPRGGSAEVHHFRIEGFI